MSFDITEQEFKKGLKLANNVLKKVDPIKATQDQSDKLEALVVAYMLAKEDQDTLKGLDEIWKNFVIVETPNDR